MRGLTRTAPPAVEPVSLSEAKAHLRVDATDDDSLIQGLIAAARQTAEEHLRRALITQNWRLTLDRFPAGPVIALPRPPLASLAAITTYDEADAATVMPAADYLVDSAETPGRVVLRQGRVWPPVGRRAAGVAIDFTAGYGAAATDVPEAIRQGILMLIGHFYERREAAVPDGRIAALPFGVAALWRPYRVLGL